jgi:O-antigen ligase
MLTPRITTSLPALPVLSCRPATYFLAYFAVMLSGFADLPRLFSFGAISALGMLSVGYFCGGLLLLPHLTQVLSLFSRKLVPLMAFILWAAISLFWTTSPMHGSQNIVVISTLLIMIWVAEGTILADVSFAAWLEKTVAHSVLLATAIYGATLVVLGPGNSDLIGARSFGVFALLGVAHFLSKWRYGKRAGLAGAIITTFLIGASQSRLALGIAVALFPLAQFPTAKFGRLIRMISVLFLAALVSYGGLIYFDSLRNRFSTGDMSLKVGSWAINVSGRLSFWRVTMQSFEEAPLWGKGAGSTEGLIESVFVDIQHAHSDYLRILHDYGGVGMALWLIAVSTLLTSLWRSWRLADQISPDTARIHLAALLSLVAFLLEMVADNAMVYPFIIAPLGLIIGSAFGLRTSVRMKKVPRARVTASV